MSSVTSRDGTKIAYEVQGSGPPLILVDGAMCYRGMGPMPALAKRLASRFTLVLYDRRGRGESGDTPPWSAEREVDDLAALIKAVGGSARLFGISSGAALALDAVARGLPVPSLAVYEPPFIVDQSRPPVDPDFIPGLWRLLAQGNRGEVVKRFMQLVGVPGFFVGVMRLFPNWRKLTGVAYTIPYDLTIMDGTQSGRPLPVTRWSAVQVSTLVLDGGKSPAWMRNGCAALADLLPAATYRTLPGQTHMVKPDVLSAALTEFLS
jgi:pimeloyl-ACP methyl ester carboxylesterase